MRERVAWQNQTKVIGDLGRQGAAGCGLRSAVCERLMLRQRNQAEQSRTEQNRAEQMNEFKCECECKCLIFKERAKQSRAGQSQCPRRVLLRCLDFFFFLVGFFSLFHHRKFPHRSAALSSEEGKKKNFLIFWRMPRKEHDYPNAASCLRFDDWVSSHFSWSAPTLFWRNFLASPRPNLAFLPLSLFLYLCCFILA
ncbi:hypothetical protein LZ31DRAFT_64182 [Colletotrichum somersetense]|nr:hypothetical protein LZ31DRAFT_64182 [Colletotrichum somersetense]